MPKRGANVFYSAPKRTRLVVAKGGRSRPPITRAPATTRSKPSRAELKDHEGILAVASPVSIGGTVSPSATMIPLGDDSQSRDGRVVYAKTFNWRMYAQCAANTTGDTSAAMRFIVFRWDDDTQPTVGDVLTAPSTVAVYNLNNVFKLKVLEDRLIAVNSNYLDTGGDAAQSTVVASGSIPLNYQMGYDDKNGTQERGAIYILYMANVNNWIDITCRAQTLYYDV